MNSEPTMPPAGLFRRFAAAVYDGFLLMGLLFIATLAVIGLLPGHRVSAGTLWFQIYLFCVMFAFYGWFWTHGGQTLGMRAWRLRVEDNDGRNISWRRAALRYPAAVVTWTTIVGLVWCVFDSEGRALHDRLSGTRVSVLPKT